MQTLVQPYQQRIEAFLDQMLQTEQLPMPGLLTAMRYSTLGGGKRMRPLLVYATGVAVRVPLSVLDYLAAAVEIIHVYSLIHDDLPAMDNDDLRRGKPTCHKRFDEATAILAGDALQALAFNVLLDTRLELEPLTRLAVLRELAHASGLGGMAGGQALDLQSQGRHLSLEQLETMHRLKTGALIRASVVMAARAGAVNQDIQDRLTHYAECIGLAFQIRDDLLDVEGHPEEIGKACGADHLLGKATFPGLLGVDASKQRAAELVASSLDALESFGPEADLLRSLARYIVERRH